MTEVILDGVITKSSNKTFRINIDYIDGCIHHIESIWCDYYNIPTGFCWCIKCFEVWDE